MFHFDEVSEEVLYTRDTITKVDEAGIDFLKEQSKINKRKRIRLCAHPNVQDSLHEMLIVHRKGNYIPPHKHPEKIESFHMVEGELKVVLFDNEGEICDVIRLNSSVLESASLFYRLSEETYHTILLTSEIVVFHEITNGPFSEDGVVFPEWAPDEDERNGYIERLTERVNLWEARTNNPAAQMADSVEKVGMTNPSNGVWFAGSDVVKVGKREIDFLKDQTRSSGRSCRLCAHKNHASTLHEMIIVHAKDTYIRPHKHIDKSVSFHVIEGLADVIIYDDQGNINDVVRIRGGMSMDANLFCRVKSSYYYTQFVRSDFLVFHETTSGPFLESQIIWAPWAPSQTGPESEKTLYMGLLRDLLR